MKPKLIYPVGCAKRLECESPLSLFHRLRKYETAACTACGFAERLECESPLSLLSRTSEIRNRSLHILWLRGAFGVRKSSFAFITNLGNTRPKLTYPVAARSVLEWSRKGRSHRMYKLRFRISEVRDKSERGLSHSKRSAKPQAVHAAVSYFRGL